MLVHLCNSGVNITDRFPRFCPIYACHSPDPLNKEDGHAIIKKSIHALSWFHLFLTAGTHGSTCLRESGIVWAKIYSEC